ncbi:MAG: Na/Pi cotransporter family protein [Actinobacteria bacterium]|nr:Na/Pi cotransporter family protein [Actinomycetota bacterium]
MPEYLKTALQVLGGLALFIFGLERLSSSLQKLASNKLKAVINIISKNPWAGVLAGVGITAIIQSSSATSVMSVGFVNAGLMTLRQAIGIIMGANLGTTVTAQIISLKVSMITFPLIIAGFLTFFIGKRRVIKNTGIAIIGIGILFLGMNIMTDAFVPLKDSDTFKNLLLTFGKNPFLGLLIGVVTTSIVQSSSATIGLLIAMASQGLIGIEAAIPILIGDNIGTCVTAMFASIGTTITAKRAAFSHLMFNIFGTIIFFILIYVFRLQNLIISISGDSVPRQIANMHTMFNFITLIILLPMIGFFEKVITKIFPGKDVVVNKNALYLEKRLISTPTIAMDQAKKEFIRVIGIAHYMLNLSMQRLESKDAELDRKVLDREAAVDSITEDIVRYLTKVSQNAMGFRLSNALTNLFHIAYDIERTGDHAESILYLGKIKEESRMRFSKAASDELAEACLKTNEIFDTLISGMTENNINKIALIEKLEAELDLIVKKIRSNHLQRLQKGQCMPLSGVVFSDVIMHLERIGDLLFGISRNLINIEQKN